tara:strand:- start:660 stop:767 length:108 start_codon:yes stop_codon:yes gene_type:complete
LLLVVLVVDLDMVVEVVLEVIEQQDLDQVHYKEQH